MSYSVEEIKDGIAFCGLICTFCRESKLGNCPGCRSKCGSCSIKNCNQKKGVNGCWECQDFPCGENMFNNKRNRAFVQCAKEDSIDLLAKYLKDNFDRGVSYHKEDGSQGDYDILGDEAKILDMLRRKGPYNKPLRYESKRFILRLVRMDDAEELLECYSDPASARLFNTDDCTSDFVYKNIIEMKDCIKLWISEYKRQYYIRFSIIDKLTHKVIGTIEIFKKEDQSGDEKIGVFRLDLSSQYEKEEFITEIGSLVNNNFYEDFSLETIITKIVPEGATRITSLTNIGYRYLKNNDYLIRRTRPKNEKKISLK